MDRGAELCQGLAVIDVAEQASALYPRVASVTCLPTPLTGIVKQPIVSGSTDALLFIHGFRTTFQEGVVTAGLLSRFLSKDTIPVAFSWPAGLSTFWIGSAYFGERESADMSVPDLKNVLLHLCSVKGLKRIHLVGHSTGTWLLCRALEELVREGRLPVPSGASIGQVILASADIDLGVFRARFAPIAEQLHADRITVYVNPNDTILGLSSMLRAEVAPRLGKLRIDNPEHDLKLSGTQIVDVSPIAGIESLGHSYLLSNPRITEDLILTLRGQSPLVRRLIPGSNPQSFYLKEDDVETTPSVAEPQRIYHGRF
jgi:esterase/lipase superfamily enzyme